MHISFKSPYSVCQELRRLSIFPLGIILSLLVLSCDPESIASFDPGADDTPSYDFDEPSPEPADSIEADPEPEVDSTQIKLQAVFDKYLLKAGDNVSHSDQTPMGKHYDGVRAATEEDKLWLADPSNEPNTLNALPDNTFQYFPVNLYPFGDPDPCDVNQKKIGDCCALAVFGSIAYNAPEFIRHIIRDNGDSTFTVAMYDPKGNPLEVALSSYFIASPEGKINQVTSKNDIACWSTVLEKAIMKWNRVFDVDKLGGIGPVAVAALFTGTGESFGFKPGELSAEEYKECVETMVNYRMIMEAGFSQAGLLIGKVKTFTSHAWTVVLSQDSTALFSMRNPWGFNNGGDGNPGDGVLNIPDDGVIPPILDIRIMYPGAMLPYAWEAIGPYYPANKK